MREALDAHSDPPRWRVCEDWRRSDRHCAWGEGVAGAPRIRGTQECHRASPGDLLAHARATDRYRASATRETLLSNPAALAPGVLTATTVEKPVNFAAREAIARRQAWYVIILEQKLAEWPQERTDACTGLETLRYVLALARRVDRHEQLLIR